MKKKRGAYKHAWIQMPGLSTSAKWGRNCLQNFYANVPPIETLQELDI